MTITVFKLRISALTQGPRNANVQHRIRGSSIKVVAYWSQKKDESGARLKLQPMAWTGRESPSTTRNPESPARLQTQYHHVSYTPTSVSATLFTSNPLFTVD